MIDIRRVEYARSALGLNENDIVIGHHKVGLVCLPSRFIMLIVSSRSSSLKLRFTSSKTSFALTMSRNKNVIGCAMRRLQRVLLVVIPTHPTHSRRGGKILNPMVN